MFANTNRIFFTMLPLLASLDAAACSKKEAEVQTQTTTAGSAPTASHPSTPPVSPGARDRPMEPGMKDHNHPMGPGMEGHADKHDGGHP